MTDVSEIRTDVRRRRKADRPKEIIEAAFTEFSRNGYASTTLDQIAERAGVTKGTIYVYFENKEHLFISMVRDITEAALDTVDDMFDTHEGSTAELLRLQFSFIYEHLVDDHRKREVMRMLIAEAPRFPELTDRYYQEILQPCIERLKQVIQRGVDRGEFRDSPVTNSPQVVIAPIALLNLWLMMFGNRQPLDLKAYFDAHLELVLNGLSAK
ncbi:MAG TPA: TetR/AcrR family transcriptional regulator [Xanthobacteraceae bacterium]|jgi:AcrR family transcriptional regulator|nr:TetR/AcrR family transcriptional regulator [Xanthobacteraceae bacterium]